MLLKPSSPQTSWLDPRLHLARSVCCAGFGSVGLSPLGKDLQWYAVGSALPGSPNAPSSAAVPGSYQLEQALLAYYAGKCPAQVQRLYITRDAPGLWRVLPGDLGPVGQLPQGACCVQVTRYVAQRPESPDAPIVDLALPRGDEPQQPWKEPCACWRALCYEGQACAGPPVSVCYLVPKPPGSVP